MAKLSEREYNMAVMAVGDTISKITELAEVIPPHLGFDANIDKAFYSMMEVFSKLKEYKPTGVINNA